MKIFLLARDMVMLASSNVVFDAGQSKGGEQY
jgi:hypothetical protein